MGVVYMKKLNKNTVVGMVIIAALLLLNVPDFIRGVGLGTGLAFMLTGIYITNYDVSKLKGFKKKFFNKHLNRK